jgi:hypothetical protein
LRPFAGTRPDAAEDSLLLACLVAPPLTTDGRWLATLRSAREFGGGKASSKQLAYRGRASWQAVIEPEIVDQLQLFRGQHHLETFVSRSVSRHVAPLRDRRKGGFSLPLGAQPCAQSKSSRAFPAQERYRLTRSHSGSTFSLQGRTAVILVAPGIAPQ